MDNAMMTVTELQELLDRRFGGVLLYGRHEEDGECCILELESVALGIPWTDSPKEVGSFDIRDLNDVSVSPEIRTKNLLPVAAAYSGSLRWPFGRKVEVAKRITILTINLILPEVTVFNESNKKEFRSVRSIEEAIIAIGNIGYEGYFRVEVQNFMRFAISRLRIDPDLSIEYLANVSKKLCDFTGGMKADLLFEKVCDVWLEAVS